jgi:predicted kinase
MKKKLNTYNSCYKGLIMKTFHQIQEGVYDPNIFNAIFLAGGPGSGKSYVVRKTTGGLGMKIVNSDEIYEKDLERAGLDIGKPEDIFSDEGQAIRLKSKSKTKARQSGWVDGRLGIIIDGTGKDVAKIGRQKALLDQLGYETMMIFVNTSLETAQIRNKERARTLPEKSVEQMWNNVQKNIGSFQSLFGSRNFIIVDNNDAGEDIFNKVYKRIRGLVVKKPSKRQAKQWIANELKKKDRR